MSHREEVLGGTSAGLGMPWCPRGQAAGGGWGEEGLGFSANAAGPVTRPETSTKRWPMDIFLFFILVKLTPDNILISDYQQNHI